jgi:hypothetical protein
MAIFEADGPAVLEALTQLPLGHFAQLAGEGVLVALSQGVEGARTWAEACVTALEERGWEGDGDLASQLGVALGNQSASDRKVLPVDLEELSWILESDGISGAGRVDLVTGEVWPGSADDDAGEPGEDLPDGDDSDRWLWVEHEGSQEGYRDMEDFIATVADEGRADRLSIAISGPGAFRRFRDVLERWPEEYERWFIFSDERRHARARAWLVSAGIVAVPASVAPRS